ncbi:DCC1-like thiol-disulfide oxidoreductase family protein [Halomicrococcus sp. SG-WS-1]|uniref:DCC1-like thiol-disulfide oxidoreductase family protein n=1 Tax=Halomicrococcus sp. SG-WS-1 TaxID=3439057 RepID=UPI003F79E949
MSDYDAVLVFDGDCPFCSAAASALRRLRDVGAISWEDDAAQTFLRAQFGETPFALVLADRRTGTVYVGREAARELCDRAGMPTLVQDIVGENYESVADAIRTVTGVDGDPDPYHGTYPLAENADAAFDELVANAGHTVKVRG